MFAAILNTLFLTIASRLVLATNTNFYGVVFIPQTPIVRFEVDVIIPSYSSVIDGSTLVSFWPGLQPEPVSALIQNVVTNDGLDVDGQIKGNEWWLLPFWCCNPAKDLTTHMRVYPGDVVKSTFLWSPSTATWYDSWAVIPTGSGQPFGGSLLEDGRFDITYANNRFSPMMQALMQIETQYDGSWSFGTLLWKNIIIEAVGSGTNWCLGLNSQQISSGLQWNKSTPTVRFDAAANTTTCYIASIQFTGSS